MGRPQDVYVSFDTVRDKNLMQLKKLNMSIFPVSYQDKFYTDALSSGDFTKLGANCSPFSLALRFEFCGKMFERCLQVGMCLAI